jgi:uncharacterized protein (DUF2141 family)
MQKIKILLILTNILVCSMVNAGTITVNITNINEIKGQIFIGLFNKVEGFPDKGHEYKGKMIKVTAKNVNYQFSEIKNGEYAIAIFHDSNLNGKLDKNFLGIPQEGYGFSNNAKATFGAPSFAKAKFKVENNHNENIKVIY